MQVHAPFEYIFESTFGMGLTYICAIHLWLLCVKYGKNFLEQILPIIFNNHPYNFKMAWLQCLVGIVVHLSPRQFGPRPWSWSH